MADGSIPSKHITQKFLKICENTPGGIAVHCKVSGRHSGCLGRQYSGRLLDCKRSSIQWSSLLVEFFKSERDLNMEIAAYIAKVEIYEYQILVTVGHEYQEFNNVWESLDDKKLTTNSLLEKLCTIKKTATSKYSSSGIECFQGTCVDHEASSSRDKSNNRQLQGYSILINQRHETGRYVAMKFRSVTSYDSKQEYFVTYNKVSSPPERICTHSSAETIVRSIAAEEATSEQQRNEENSESLESENYFEAGLGRTGTLIGAYLVKHYHMAAREAIAWLRICRPGCVIGRQQTWLEDMEGVLWKLGEDYRYYSQQTNMSGKGVRRRWGQVEGRGGKLTANKRAMRRSHMIKFNQSEQSQSCDLFLSCRATKLSPGQDLFLSRLVLSTLQTVARSESSELRQCDDVIDKTYCDIIQGHNLFLSRLVLFQHYGISTRIPHHPLGIYSLKGRPREGTSIGHSVIKQTFALPQGIHTSMDANIGDSGRKQFGQINTKQVEAFVQASTSSAIDQLSMVGISESDPGRVH
uniref:(California timema) hypothetical protein n=1 Tax=Timema californicum TaxID=61474 RepID=A0A7R9PCM9_TIMCA|nr:unnamed protein product [Timema californicum]